MNHNNNNNLASASFKTMNEPFIPTQTIVTVIPTIPAISKLPLTNLITFNTLFMVRVRVRVISGSDVMLNMSTGVYTKLQTLV